MLLALRDLTITSCLPASPSRYPRETASGAHCCISDSQGTRSVPNRLATAFITAASKAILSGITQKIQAVPCKQNCIESLIWLSENTVILGAVESPIKKKVYQLSVIMIQPYSVANDEKRVFSDNDCHYMGFVSTKQS